MEATLTARDSQPAFPSDLLLPARPLALDAATLEHFRGERSVAVSGQDDATTGVLTR